MLKKCVGLFIVTVALLLTLLSGIFVLSGTPSAHWSHSSGKVISYIDRYH